jgi:monoamine oxidase
VSRLRGLVIVGGGAAGIGAAREAQALGIDALIVEASDRLGGRAHTIDWHGHKLDLGCGWLHSAERNSLRIEAERLGVPIDRTMASWFEQYRDLGLSADDQKAMRAAFDGLEERMRLDPPPSDRASDAMEPGNPWNAWLDAISGYINGAPLSEVSVADWLAYDNSSGRSNWRLPGGYGALIASIGVPLEHRLATPVTAISRGREAVQLTTPDGTIEAERAIVTVPTATLARIRFDPPIDAAIAAAAQLPLGLADKLFLALDRPEDFPHNAHLIGDPHSAETASYMLRPIGMPVVEAYFGGLGVRAAERMGDEAATAFAIDQLAALLGNSIRNRLTPIVMSHWSSEPWIGGSYSHACPGHASGRLRLAEAGDDRIAFAGEAVSVEDYSTAHGAFDSGSAAVRRLYGDRLDFRRSS